MDFMKRETDLEPRKRELAALMLAPISNEALMESYSILRNEIIVRGLAQETIQEAFKKMNYEEFLNNMLENELLLRRENGVKSRLRAARFPYKKYIEDFNTDNYNRELIHEFQELSSLKFIEDRENIILIGSPGSGKTHYSIGLGIKACRKGLSVLFISVPNLMIELKEAMYNGLIN